MNQDIMLSYISTPVPRQNKHSHRTTFRLLPPYEVQSRPDALDQFYPILHLPLPTIKTLCHGQVSHPQPCFRQAPQSLPRRRQYRIHHHRERARFHSGPDMPEDLLRLA